MEKLKIIKIFFTIFVIIAGFNSCARIGYSEVNFFDDSSAEKLTYQSLIGTWQTACFFATEDNVYSRLTMSFTANGEFLVTINNYDINDSQCTGDLAPLSHTVSGPASLGSEQSPGNYALDLEITGFGTIYNLIHLSSGVIYTGLQEINYDGSTPEKRPVQINNQLGFAKISGFPYLDAVGTWKTGCFLEQTGNDYRKLITIWEKNLLFTTLIEMYDLSDTTCSGPKTDQIVSGKIYLQDAIATGIYAYNAEVNKVNGAPIPPFTIYNILSAPYPGALQTGLLDGLNNGTTEQTRPTVLNTQPNETFIKQP